MDSNIIDCDMSITLQKCMWKALNIKEQGILNMVATSRDSREEGRPETPLCSIRIQALNMAALSRNFHRCIPQRICSSLASPSTSSYGDPGISISPIVIGMTNNPIAIRHLSTDDLPPPPPAINRRVVVTGPGIKFFILIHQKLSWFGKCQALTRQH